MTNKQNENNKIIKVDFQKKKLNLIANMLKHYLNINHYQKPVEFLHQQAKK